MSSRLLLLQVRDSPFHRTLGGVWEESYLEQKCVMADQCDLVQYTISKGGTACVMGTCQGAINWSALTTDYLLLNTLSNQRYHTVICLNFEGLDITTRCNDMVDSWNRRNSSNNRTTKSFPSDWRQKLVVLNGQFSDKDNKYRLQQPQNLSDGEVTNDKDIWGDILAGVTTASAARPSQVTASRAAEETTAPSVLTNINGNCGNVAVALYSLSELILTVGFQQTKLFIRRLADALQQHQQQQVSAATGTTSSASAAPAATATPQGSGSNCAAHAPCLILSVHQSLHSAEVNAQLQGLASVLVRVVPNSGTLAETVAAEIQTVRRSAGTGKISESTEMFSCAEGLLCPIKPVATVPGAITTGTAGSAEDSSARAAQTDAHTVAALPSREEVQSSAADAQSGVKKNTGAVLAPMAANQRLITFDSTDPEFDEDSDPDADLDL